MGIFRPRGGQASNEPNEEGDSLTQARPPPPPPTAAAAMPAESPAEEGEDPTKQLRASLAREKAAKRKMYSYLVKIADELKALRAESERLVDASEYATRAWHEGGMWRGPNVLPAARRPLPGRAGAGGNPEMAEGTSSGSNGARPAGERAVDGGPDAGLVPRAPVSLSDLFLDLVTVTAFTRTGSAIQDRGSVDLSALAYFAVFWCVWSKEASYSTRFDTTDLSSQFETLLACFALLGGSLSAHSKFDEPGCDRVMAAAAFVSAMHVLLHARVWRWFSAAGRAEPGSVNPAVKDYAVFVTIMNSLETVAWVAGTMLPLESRWRPWIFLVGVLCNMRLPQGYMPNDFHAACSKRGVLFILLLGFNLQSIVVAASPYFNYWDPTWDQYAFLFLACFLLFAIKLLYVDDTHSVAPRDHALLYNQAAGLFFHLGNFALLLSTTVLGSGLNLLAQSFLAAGGSLPGDAKKLVCGGFGAVVFSIAFVKSLHIRRVPTDPNHERMFFVAYSTQVVVVLAVVYVTMRMCLSHGAEGKEIIFAVLMGNEITMLSVLAIFSALLVAMSWLDETIELYLYGGEIGAKADVHRVQPFLLWSFCFKHDESMVLEHGGGGRRGLLAQRSPLYGSSRMSFSSSLFNSSAALSTEDV